MDKLKWLIIIAFFVIMSFFSVLLLKKQQKDNNKENESRLIIQGKIIRVHKIEKNAKYIYSIGIEELDANDRKKYDDKLTENEDESAVVFVDIDTEIIRNGSVITMEELQAGMFIKCFGSGDVKETFPSQISDISRIEVDNE